MTEIVTFGPIDENVRSQMEACRQAEPGAPAVLCADNHLGYSMPIGGVIAYRDHISPSAVGYDIGCGNKAVRTGLKAADVDLPRVMDELWARLSFGMGRRNEHRVEAQVLDDIASHPLRVVRDLTARAAAQLGTIGGGNHYIDLLADIVTGDLWVGVHFGSRGFGHTLATWAITTAEGTTRVNNDMMAPPVMIRLTSELGGDYHEVMRLAGEYAYAGRDWVVDFVVREVLQTTVIDTVHNHHNFAWRETHGGEEFMVHRKGSTPAFPGQRGFVGGSMGDVAVIVRGDETARSRQALYSTIHGAGRQMSRTQAAGKFNRRTGEQIKPGLIDWPAVQAQLRQHGVELRGGGADEAPGAYKSLRAVLDCHAETILLESILLPVGVAMAGREEFDPYKD